MPSTIPRPPVAILAIASTISNSFIESRAGIDIRTGIEYETRRQLLAEDPAHRGEILPRGAIQIEIRKRPSHQIQRHWRNIARRVSRPPGNRGDRILRLRILQQRLDPA